MNFFLRAAVLTLLFSLASSTAWAGSYSETKRMFEKAGIADLFTSAFAYALFPTIGKAGFVIGGAYGKGRVYVQGKHYADTSMTQATVGFQMGGTGFSQVIFFQDKRAFGEFANGNFEFGADVQATALTAAAGVSANTSGNSAAASGGKNNASLARGGYNKGMATYTITKGGLMYEASIGGQTFSYQRR